MAIPGFFYSAVNGPSWLQPHINPDPRNRINLLHVPPPVEGGFRGGGGIDADRVNFSFLFNDEHYTLSAIFWFWLPKSHVEPFGQGRYLSEPIANITGFLRASTLGRSLAEEPVLTCDLELRQEIDCDDGHYSSSPITYPLVHLHRRSNTNIYRTFRGDRFAFPSVSCYVEDPDTALVITLRVEMRFWRDASGHFWFHPYGDDEHFRIDVPRWRLGFSPSSRFS